MLVPRICLNQSRCRLGADLGPRNHILDGDKDRTNPFAAAKGDESAMRPFAKLLWALVPPVIVSVDL